MPFVSWSRLLLKQKGNSRMSRRAGLDHEAVVEAAAKLVDEEGIEPAFAGSSG